jgi:enoyl-CoA hydratase/carnithine racemase
MSATGLDSDVVLFEVVHEHIAVVTLNRPRKKNAVNGAVTTAMAAFVQRIERDDSIRVAILTSSSAEVFSAGADLLEISEGRSHTLMTPDGGFAGFVRARRDKPWIAAARGAVLAGGCELVLACDMIVAARDSRFGLPEVKRGLLAGGGGVDRLPRALPRNVALELIATGDPLEAERAFALGMVNRLVPADQVLTTAIALADAIGANAPLAVRESLRVARQAGARSEADMRHLSDEAGGRVFSSEDAREGPRAFLEKRAPRWNNR